MSKKIHFTIQNLDRKWANNSVAYRVTYHSPSASKIKLLSMLNYIVLQIQHPELLLITKLKRETKGNWLPPYKSFWNMDELSILLYVYVTGFSSGHYDKFTKLISLMFHLGDTLVREMNSVFVLFFFYLERIVVETFFFFCFVHLVCLCIIPHTAMTRW